jgi:DNA invertase Pin-like site-specific DNA recombinase
LTPRLDYEALAEIIPKLRDLHPDVVRARRMELIRQGLAAGESAAELARIAGISRASLYLHLGRQEESQ